jgi:hypothetical protein
MKKETPAFHLYAAARGNAEAAKMIQLSPFYPSKATQVHLPLSNGIALSMELHLKAWLSHHGVPEAVFSAPKIRHDLQGLFELAVSNGLAGLHPQTPDLAETLGPFYKGHEYRYMHAGITMPTLNYPLVFAVLDALDARVRNAIDAEAQAAKALEREAAAANS